MKSTELPVCIMDIEDSSTPSGIFHKMESNFPVKMFRYMSSQHIKSLEVSGMQCRNRSLTVFTLRRCSMSSTDTIHLCTEIFISTKTVQT